MKALRAILVDMKFAYSTGFECILNASNVLLSKHSTRAGSPVINHHYHRNDVSKIPLDCDIDLEQ